MCLEVELLTELYEAKISFF